jgi:hypothetical protein
MYTGDINSEDSPRLEFKTGEQRNSNRRTGEQERTG